MAGLVATPPNDSTVPDPKRQALLNQLGANPPANSTGPDAGATEQPIDYTSTAQPPPLGAPLTAGAATPDPNTAVAPPPTTPTTPTDPVSGAAPPTTATPVTQTDFGAPGPDPFAASGGGSLIGPAGNQGWIPNNNPASPGFVGAPAPPDANAPPDAAAAPATTGGAPTQQNLDDATRQKLLDLMNPTATDAATLATSPDAEAERDQSQRSAEAATAQAAEQAARNGTSGSGGAAGIARGITQTQGANDTQFLGQLAQQKTAQDIQNTQFALTQAQQSGQFDQAQALQQQLAQLQASTSTGIANIGANAQIAANQNNVGFQYAQLQQQANQNALLALLSGGGSGAG